MNAKFKLAVVGFGVVALAAFQLAYEVSWLNCLMVIYLWVLVKIVASAETRTGFYTTLAVGFLNAAIQLRFMWGIFGAAAIPIWMILALWLALFAFLAGVLMRRFGRGFALFFIPIVWTGLEYFRSELYYLKFSWLSEGYPFSKIASLLPFHFVGMYGWSFVLMALVCFAIYLGRKWQGMIVFGLCVILFATQQVGKRMALPQTAGEGTVKIAGMQMEFPAANEIIQSLDKLITTVPDAPLLVLSEYTMDGAPPQKLKDWCKAHKKFLIVGGKDDLDATHYYNTAFVIDDYGSVVFKQVKSVPIQFFKDGTPARQQDVWKSPWGNVGICICYDLSYTRVTDGLIQRGAQMLIVPTMDVVDWGEHQHKLHSWVAPVRAREYGVPIFRLASSGISQVIDSSGRVTASAPMPGDGAILSGIVSIKEKGCLPWDRWFAPFCVSATLALMAFLIADPLVQSPKHFVNH